MSNRALLHKLFAILLLLAGPASASHADMTAMDAHCESMDTATEHVHQPPEPQADDCDSQCACCPGSCSSAAVLTANTLPTAAATGRLTAPIPAGVPHHLPAQPQRPPIFA